MSIRYDLDYQEVEKLEEKFRKVPDNVENIINQVLHNEGIKRTTAAITKELPVSNRTKKHAKYSKWSKSEKHNLGFTVKTKGGAAKNPGSFGYLVFPNEGRGPHNPLEQRFMEEGLEKTTPEIIELISERIDNFLEEEF
ncbi:hypothetical protein SAMN05421743_12138 [Thalassobacillus cyri]|uniref:Uncharacterized protein n=1 Tax=Thalassobacillus cyri TaxID=571932 RepID=A0A1H4H3S4_9BACI|nr:hypothetical protein [Thalassobacillus cyri]SEB15748.1 hypothetical protein SAMN05421743_12138 [Thalassobacillus cyri]